MGGGIQLPKFTDLGALPAANRRVWFIGWGGMGVTVSQSPVAHLSAIQFKAVETEGFRSSEAVGTRRGAGQTFYQEVNDGLRPRFCVVSTRTARHPKGSLFLGTSSQIIRGENIELATGKAEFVGGFGGGK